MRENVPAHIAGTEGRRATTLLVASVRGDKMTEPTAVAATAYVLPWWMQWVQAIGVAVISGAGVYIAYRQSRIATAKLNLDLYDRRFKVFDATRKYISDVFTSDNLPRRTTEFNIETADTVFLFGSEIEEYIERLRRRGVGLHAAQGQLRLMDERGQVGEQRNALVDRVSDIEEGFANEYRNLIAAFKPYLRLGNL